MPNVLIAHSDDGVSMTLARLTLAVRADAHICCVSDGAHASDMLDRERYDLAVVGECAGWRSASGYQVVAPDGTSHKGSARPRFILLQGYPDEVLASRVTLSVSDQIIEPFDPVRYRMYAQLALSGCPNALQIQAGKFDNWIRERLGQHGLHVADVCEAFSVSRSKLHYLLTSSYGMGFSKRLNHHRIARSRELMVLTRLLVK